MATKANKTKDFDVDTLLAANETHEQKIAEISKRVDALENRIMTTDGFARAFDESSRNDKRIDEAIEKVIDNHDKHKLIIGGTAVLKWLSGAIVGAVITALISLLISKSS